MSTPKREPRIAGREAEAMMRAGHEVARLWMLRWWYTLRFRVGSWIIGGGYHGAVMRLWLVHDRAAACITRDGGVIFAHCPPLAQALYEPIPGLWKLSVERVEEPEAPPPQGAVEGPSPSPVPTNPGDNTNE